MQSGKTMNNDTKTQVGHWIEDNCTIYIGRGEDNAHMLNTEIGQHGWLGNPFTVDDHGRERCIELFREVFEVLIADDPEFRSAVEELHGDTLGCWCQHVYDDEPACHGEIIAQWANQIAYERHSND